MTSPPKKKDPGSEKGPLDAGDRLLEFALEELARGRSQGGSRHRGPDMVAIVRAAHARGERGQDISGLAINENASGNSSRDHSARAQGQAGGQATGQFRGQSRGVRRKSRASNRPGPRARPPQGWIPVEHRRIAAAALFLILAGALAWVLLWNSRDRNQGGPNEGPESPFIADGEGAAGEGGPGNEQPELETPDPLIADLDTKRSPIAVEPLASMVFEEPPGFYTGPWEATRTGQIQGEILAALGERPESWPFFQGEVIASMDARFIGPLPGKRLIALAKLAPQSSGTELARALWLRIPHLFTTQDLLTFGERRLFEFERELVSLALVRDPEALALSGGPDLLANAWLLNRGDSRGIDTVRASIERTILDSVPRLDPESLQRGVITIALAARLVQAVEGGDAWDRAHARISEVVLGFADAGNYESAGRALAALEYMRLTPAPPEFPIRNFTEEYLAYIDKVEWFSPDRDGLVARLEQCVPWGR